MSNKRKVGPSKRRKRKVAHTLRLEPFIELHGIWEITKTDGQDPVFTFENHDVQTETMRHFPTVKKWAFAAMKDYFAIKSSDDALSFFKEYGPLQLAPGPRGKLRGTATPVRYSAVIERRDYWLNASRRRIEDFQHEPTDIRGFFDDLNLLLPLRAELMFNSPVLAVRCLDVEEALKACVHIDRLNGLAWGLCAWKKCGKPFPIGSHPEKKFCSLKCAGRQTSKTWWDKPENKQRSNGRRKKGPQ